MLRLSKLLIWLLFEFLVAVLKRLFSKQNSELILSNFHRSIFNQKKLFLVWFAPFGWIFYASFSTIMWSFSRFSDEEGLGFEPTSEDHAMAWIMSSPFTFTKRPGVDFTNVFARIFCSRFSYQRLFSSYVLQNTRAKNVGEIDPRC